MDHRPTEDELVKLVDMGLTYLFRQALLFPICTRCGAIKFADLSGPGIDGWAGNFLREILSPRRRGSFTVL